MTNNNNLNNNNNDQCDEYGCYPGVLTKFAVDDTKRGCGDYQFSGQDSAISPCGSGCCIFCVPVAFVLDIAFFIPCSIGWGVNKCKNKCKIKAKPVITIQPHPQHK